MPKQRFLGCIGGLGCHITWTQWCQTCGDTNWTADDSSDGMSYARLPHDYRTTPLNGTARQSLKTGMVGRNCLSYILY
uniref:Putative secreted peptide n=1 Tax=Anopheles braziliensis TaxID=58242 RepID=A0A2M3ZWU7_9DIPT